MAKDFQLFLHTVDEYKRFANHLPVKSSDSLTDDYSEADYIGIQVRLMLLRKFYAQSKQEKVYIKNIIAAAQQKFPTCVSQFEALSDEFDRIESQQLEHILSDGTKLNTYNTIEDSVYGLYLHADKTESIDLETLWKQYVFSVQGNTSQQSITASPYWSNVYGHDANDEDMVMIGKELTQEELQILELCINFTDALKEPKLDIRKLQAFVHPAARDGWGDFSQAKAFFLASLTQDSAQR